MFLYGTLLKRPLDLAVNYAEYFPYVRRQYPFESEMTFPVLVSSIAVFVFFCFLLFLRRVPINGIMNSYTVFAKNAILSRYFVAEMLL